MKRSIIIILIIFLNSIISFSQVPNWEWVRSAIGTKHDYGLDVCTDNNGCVYVTGGFNSPEITFGSITLVNAGFESTDIYIVKYDSLGNVIWAKRFGGDGNDYGNSVSTDKSGNVYLAGQYTSTTITFGGNVFANAGADDIFLIKLDGSGNILWAKCFGANSWDVPSSVTTDTSGNVYILGMFASANINFDGYILTNQGYSDVFVAKFDSSGNFNWVRNIRGYWEDYSSVITTDKNCNIYIVGCFNSSALILGTIDLTYLPNNGDFDIFIAKYSNNGDLLWARSYGGNHHDDGNGVATDENNNVIVTGRFTSPTISVDSLTFINESDNNTLVIKLDSLGNLIWAKCSKGESMSEHIATDKLNNIYVTGLFSNSITFDSTTVTNSSYGSIFISKFNSNGNIVWIKASGNNGNNGGRSVVTDLNNNVYLVGYFESSIIEFDTIEIQNTDTASFDLFVAKLNANFSNRDSLQNNNDLIIYPNPTNGGITITLPTNTNEVDIYNALGQIVFRRNNFTENKLVLKLMASGIYYARIFTDTESITKKIIVSN